MWVTRGPFAGGGRGAEKAGRPPTARVCPPQPSHILPPNSLPSYHLLHRHTLPRTTPMVGGGGCPSRAEWVGGVREGRGRAVLPRVRVGRGDAHRADALHRGRRDGDDVFAALKRIIWHLGHPLGQLDVPVDDAHLWPAALHLPRDHLLWVVRHGCDTATARPHQPSHRARTVGGCESEGGGGGRGSRGGVAGGI